MCYGPARGPLALIVPARVSGGLRVRARKGVRLAACGAYSVFDVQSGNFGWGSDAAMTRRSSRAEVRSPVLALPAARLIRAMPANIRALLAVLLLDLAADARRRSRKIGRAHV